MPGSSQAQYFANRLVRDAVTWNFCVIGEALAQLTKSDPLISNRITGARKNVGLRNQLIYGYGVIDHDITWRVITDHLPVLISELRELLT